MPKSLDTVLAAIEKGAPPSVILVGGTSEFLAERAFRQIRDSLVARNPGIALESYEPGTDLGTVLDSFRTMSLFGGMRLIVLPEVNAFVSAKEISSLFDKATAEWKSAKTDRKRATASAKLLHLLGLTGCDLEMKDRAIADAIGVALDATLSDMLAFCRTTGRKASRGEDDAALLMESIAQGGAPSTILLMRTGEIPRDSATTELIDRRGAVIVANISREKFAAAMDEAVAAIAEDAGVRFDAAAVARLRQRLGIDRILGDKFSKEVPELRTVVSEAERLATLAGSGGRVTAELVDREIAAVEGGARYELGSLFTEGKIVEAVAKLRELVAQARREDPKMPVEMQYGRFLFPIADELRQMIGVHSWAQLNQVNLRASMQYNRFKDTVAEPLGDYLKAAGIVRQKPHAFPLYKKWEAARSLQQKELFRALNEIAELEIGRKSGGIPADVGLETFLLSHARG